MGVRNKLLMFLLPVFALCNRSPLIEVEQGKIRGIVKTDWKGGRFYSFFKVPYAKPPVGELRFKDPQPAEKWVGILEATNDMTECVQFNMKKEIMGQEDCLYMNIYTPQVSTKSLKPVMVFLHGGRNAEGTGKQDPYGPEFLVPEGIVLVTLQYRLGLFGFLNFENPKVGVPGNAGLKDQNMALRWVRKNIEIFGGDPKSVTLFGESAGGASAHMHMLSPLSQGLIHRVICQSGTALNIWNAGVKNTGIYAAEVLKYPTENEEEVLEHLQSVSIEDIMKIQEKYPMNIPIHEVPLIGPVMEPLHSGDIFLSESPEDILSRGKFNKVPFMLGYNSDEALMLYTYDMLTHGELKTMPHHHIIPYTLELKDDEAKNKVFERIMKQYSIDEYRADSNIYIKLISDIYMTHSAYLSVREHSRVNHKDLYLYIFFADTQLNFVKRMHEFTSKTPGTAHGDERGYLFKSKFTPNNLTQESIEGQNIQRVVKLWTNFAKYGTPTPKQKELGVLWKPVKNNVMHYLAITTNSISPKVDPFDKQDMHFWDKLLGKSAKLEHTEL